MQEQILLQKARSIEEPDPILPSRAYTQDAGVDLHVEGDVWLWPFVVTEMPTGWNVKVPDDHVGIVTSRSSTFKRMHISVHLGIIDASYTGHLCVLVRNLSLWPRKVKRGVRLAQLLVVPCLMVDLLKVNRLPITGRGTKGFGSTGFEGF